MFESKTQIDATDSIKHTTGELPAELVELVEEDLKQIVGGAEVRASADADFVTATRDPAFFRLNKYIDNLFKEHKD